MKQHEFSLVLSADPSEDEADRMYGTFNDGTIATTAGVPQIHFHREAVSLEEYQAMGTDKHRPSDKSTVSVSPLTLTLVELRPAIQ